MGTDRNFPESTETLRLSIPDPEFVVEGAKVQKYSVTPNIAFNLRISNPTARPIHNILLRCQVQIAVLLRQYDEESRRRLADLFGRPDQWAETLRSILWTNVSTVVPAFQSECTWTLSVPCTFDFNVAATKYVSALTDGDLPLTFLFSGTIFYTSDSGRLRAGQISWEKECTYRMPTQVWHEMMGAYYPDTAWLCLQRDAFERLNAFRIQNGIPTFEQALERVLP